MRDPKRIQGSSRRREDPLPDVDLHAKEGKNRFHGERERERKREEVAFKSPCKSPLTLSPPGGEKKENPTRAQLAPNANDEVKRARLDRTQKHSIQTYALVFIQHLFRIIAVSLRANLIFSISRPQKTLKPLLRAQISRRGREEMSIAARTVVLLARRENESYENQIEITHSF